MTATSTTTVGTHNHSHVDGESGAYLSTDTLVQRGLIRSHIEIGHHLSEGAVHDELHRLTTALEQAEQATTTARQAAWDNALAEGRLRALEEVREWVIDHQSTYSLCDDGVNTFFEAFGLDPKTREYRVQISRTITQSAYITVEATDYGDAWERAREDVHYGDAEYGVEWDNDDVSAPTVEDVTES